MVSMTSPTARLEAKLQVQMCKVCAWLETLEPANRKAWVQAIANPRFSAPLVASELRADGADVGEGSVLNHRQKGHR